MNFHSHAKMSCFETISVIQFTKGITSFTHNPLKNQTELYCGIAPKIEEQLIIVIYPLKIKLKGGCPVFGKPPWVFDRFTLLRQ